MNSPLGKRHMKALEALRYEVDYEDHHKGGTENYILRSGLPVGIGEETLADLVKAGLAVMGPYRLSGFTHSPTNGDDFVPDTWPTLPIPRNRNDFNNNNKSNLKEVICYPMQR